MEAKILNLFEEETNITTDEAYFSAVNDEGQVVLTQKHSIEYNHDHNFPGLTGTEWSLVTVSGGEKLKFTFERGGELPGVAGVEKQLLDAGIMSSHDTLDEGTFEDAYFVCNDTAMSEKQIRKAIKSNEFSFSGIHYSFQEQRMKMKVRRK